MKNCVIIPTLNEEKGITETITTIPKGYDIFVVDSYSKDNTVKIAKKLGAKIIYCKKLGKGNAVKKAVEKLNYDIYILIDGDGSYNGKYIPLLSKKIESGEGDLVLGSRFLGKPNGFTFFRFITNKILTKTINFLNNANITDISTGLRAMSKRFVRNLNTVTNDFRIETEITLYALKNRYKILEVPINYEDRLGKSKIKVLDMLKIYIYGIKESLR